MVLPPYQITGSEVVSGGHTDRQSSDLISLLSFFEIRLKGTS
jgi:hypothetical protein